MPRVVSTGGLISLESVPQYREPTPDRADFSICIFVVLDDGTRVDDPRGHTAAVYHAPMPESLGKVEDDFVRSLTDECALPTMRRASWEGVIDELRARHGVDTDPESLLRLPFRLVPDDDVRRRFGESRRSAYLPLVTTHALGGVDLKLGRAEEHLRFLHEQRDALPALKGGIALGQLDPKTGDYVVRVQGEPPPDGLGIPISEFAHALRTALDNLLWQLILARGGTPVAKVTQFPINEHESAFEGKPKRRPRSGEPAWPTEADRLMWGISTDDRAFIKRAQPFQAGRNAGSDPLAERAAKAHPLAMLADLNNIDKHRYIHAAFAAAAVRQAHGAEHVFRFTEYTVVRGGEDVKIVPVLWASPRLNPALMMFGMPMLRDEATGEIITGFQLTSRDPDDRTEIAYVPANQIPHPNVGMHPPMTFEVSLSDRERPMTIFDFDDILQEVRRIVEHFRSVIV